MRSIPLLLCFALLSPVFAHASRLADVEVYDVTTQRVLPVHRHEGRLYVVGEPKHRYAVRIRNRSHARLLATTSVDGVNVITGETADEQQSGYVLDAWSSVEIDGWRKSLDEVARFYFTRLPDSYAARTGRPHDVGVIGVALFREREPCCNDHQDLAESAAEAPRASAPTEDAESDGVQSQRSRGAKSEARLGTGHGERQSSHAHYVDFRRASSTPDETIVIYYDSKKNLIASGVLPPAARVADRRPNPFPNGFTPDP